MLVSLDACPAQTGERDLEGSSVKRRAASPIEILVNGFLGDGGQL
jgi:hypothetical protein